jgi:hypothetical protein
LRQVIRASSRVSMSPSTHETNLCHCDIMSVMVTSRRVDAALGNVKAPNIEVVLSGFSTVCTFADLIPRVPGCE